MDAYSVGSFLGDTITALALATAGFFAFLTMRRADCGNALPSSFALIAGAGLVMLALDEWFGFHEYAGRWMWNRGVTAPGPVHHVDDLIVIGYAFVGLLVCVLALPSLVHKLDFAAGLLLAASVLTLAAAVDALGTPGTWTEIPEETLEAVGAVILATVFAVEALQLRAHPMLRARTTATLITPARARLEDGGTHG